MWLCALIVTLSLGETRAENFFATPTLELEQNQPQTQASTREITFAYGYDASDYALAPKSTPSTLHTRGVTPTPGTRVRPDGIPKDWKVRPTKSGGGVEYFNPKNPNQNVRVMQGNPNSPYPNSQAPYARQRGADGTYLRADGTKSPLPRGGLKDPDAHIPLDQFQVQP